jgi:LacI family transcriptional regulator
MKTSPAKIRLANNFPDVQNYWMPKKRTDGKNGKKRIPSMRDIAAMCGVSATTVSKALRDDPIISEAQREKIKEVATRLRYRPNLLVDGIMQGRSRNIAIIRTLNTAGTAGAIDENIMHAVDQAMERGFCSILFNSHQDIQREAKCIELAIQNRVSGLLISTVNFTANESHFEELRDNDIPFVILDPFAAEVDAPRVHADDRYMGYSVTKYLIDLGHQRIAHLGEPTLNLATGERFEGYKAALHEAGLPLRKELLQATDFSYSSGYHGMQNMLKLSRGRKTPPFSAVFAGNYNLAFGAIEALEKAGLKVPEDCSVAGAGIYRVFSHFHRLRLTTFDQKAGETGQLAANLLIDRITGKIPAGAWNRKAGFLIRGELVVGETTAPPPARARQKK